MSWHLVLVGTPAIQSGGRTMPLPVERRGQLVALLALRGDWMQRAEVAALLWPDVAQSLASTNLRKAVFRAREAPWGGCIESDGTALRVVATHDVAAFHTSVGEGRLADALAQTRGELLAGFDDDANEAWTGWLRVQRERWRTDWRAAALERLAQDLPTDEALRLSAALLEDDPQDEAALHAQLTRLAAQGQHARARELYREFARRMQQDLGLAPGDALRALHERLQAQPTSATPQPATSSDGGYVGRVFEQRRIAELMQRPDCRLLAIVGPGGIGKTRLVRRALEALAPLFADGALFVPLEDLADAAALLPRLARALGLARSTTHDGAGALVEHLHKRSMLLVLDNFEQLAAEGTALLEQLLQGAPGLKLLVTSRERLSSAVQWALPLDGLPCPEPEDVDRLEAFDAARLFVAAARRADPSFDAGAEQHAIAQICRQVDGLPLALEMAAAWTRVMRCDAIARELRQGSELLTAANPAFPARQASVEAVFDQSWRLLGARERAALARLSVFRGGFTVEAARAAAGAPLAVQGALLDKSLLQKNGARLGLHPLLQQFAARRLAEGPDEAAARAAHAEHFRWFLDTQGTGARRGHADALQAIDDDFENCCLAWQWLAAHGPGTALAAPARALSDHADHRGQPQRGLALLQQALDGPVVAADAALRARLLALAAHLSYRSDRFSDAAHTAQQALDGATEGDPQTRQCAHQVIASAALRQGRLDEAGEHFRAVLELSDATTRNEDRAATLDHLALVEKRLGRFDEALRLSLEALRLHRQLDDPAGTALCLNNLATIYSAREETEAAEAPLREALVLCERAGLASTQVLVLANLGEAAVQRKAWDAAEAFVVRGIEMAASTGQRLVFGWLHALRARLAIGRGDHAAARDALAVAAELALQLEAPQIKAATALEFARLLHAQGQARAAGRVLVVASGDALLGAGEQERLHKQRLAWVPEEEPLAPTAPLKLDALLHRVASEASQRHAALALLLAS